MIARDFSPQGKVAQSIKDFSLILSEAEKARQILPLASVYAVLMQGCIEHGEADLDNAAVIEQIRRMRSSGAQ
jgi:3-hydroxyisobutyrate dehydrogenase-like beta-hydroxyacid dehydrogenase